MTLTGENFIGFKNSAEGSRSFQAFASTTNDYLQGDFTIATKNELEKVLALADTAFPGYREISASRRADFLDAIAHEIMELGDALIERCCQESFTSGATYNRGKSQDVRSVANVCKAFARRMVG